MGISASIKVALFLTYILILIKRRVSMSKIKIAIVEDEQASRDMLARYLHDYSTEENVDLIVTTYIDGDYFLANYGKGKYDIVFMDICMSGTDGMSAARKL